MSTPTVSVFVRWYLRYSLSYRVCNALNLRRMLSINGCVAVCFWTMPHLSQVVEAERAKVEAACLPGRLSCHTVAKLIQTAYIVNGEFHP